MASFGKMGLLFLNKRRLRTVLTIVAIVLGVGILTGVNVTADSIDQAINLQIYAKLGNNDIIVRGNRSVNGGWFNYTPAQTFLNNVEGVKTAVPRIIKAGASLPQTNHTSGWWTSIIALDTNNINEKTFGTCNITDALDGSYVNTSRIEDLFQKYSSKPFPVVISRNYANYFNINCSGAGKTLYMLPEKPSAFGSGIDSRNTTTWLQATIIGIIQDTSEAVSDFMPPAQTWEMYPPSTAVYVDLNVAWTYLFNSHPNQINMFFVQCEDLTQAAAVRTRIEETAPEGMFPGKVFTDDVKSLFTAGILQVNSLMRGIFSIFSGISLLVCAIIIKNLLEMAKEEQTHEIGIMRAIGVTRGKIMVLYIAQILFISLVGSAIGLIVGYFLSSIFVNSYVDVAAAVGTDFSKYAITPIISPLTVGIAFGAGVFTCLIFGMIPARAAANVDPLEALRSVSETKRQSVLVRAVKTTGSLTIAIVMTVAGVIIVGSAFGGLFLLDIINPEIIVLLFFGVIFLVIGIVLLGAFFFPVAVPILTSFFSPILRQTRTITSRNMMRYARQTKNTFAMLAIGLCMMITVGTIMNSAYAGAYPGGKTITGGDLQIGDLYRGQIPKDPHARGLRDLPSVAQAVPIRFSLGFEGITRLDRLATNKTFGGKADSAFGVVRESFHLGIIDPIEYGKLHTKDSIVRLQNKAITLNALMQNLESPYTIILQDRLARRMGIEEGERVRLRFDGFEADFTVIGVFEVLPGFYWTYYSTESTYDKQFVGAISWRTYSQLVDDNIGKTDLIVRNKVNPGNYSTLLPNEQLWGYAAEPIDYTTLESLMSQTGMVKSSTRRQTSAFPTLPQFQWRTNSTDPNEDLNQTWIDQGVLYNKPNALSRTWNNMFSRATVINPATDKGFGNTTIRAIHPNIPASANKSIEDLFAWAVKNFTNTNICAVNEMYVNYNISTGTMDYIKRFTPGETIRIYYNDSISIEFLIVATTNSHYLYEYVDKEGNHHGDTMVFNYEAMSFNTYTVNTTKWNYFFEVFDAEPNTVLIPSTGIQLPLNFTQGLIPSILGNYTYNETQPITDNSTWWLNTALQDLLLLNYTAYSGNVSLSQWAGNYTFNGQNYVFDGAQFTLLDEKFGVNFTVNLANGSQILEALQNGSLVLQMENFTSVVMFDLNDNMSYNDLHRFIQVMEQVCKNVPTLRNAMFFAPKLFMLEESKLFHAYFLIGAESKGQIDAALYEIQNYYITHGLGWEDSWVQKATDMEGQVSGILGLIINMFFGVLSFALIVSLLGLAISTLISVKKRYAEFGILRTLGFSSTQILKMIVSEGVITAILGILVGTIAGLLIAYLIVSNLPFMIFLPIIFTPPLEIIGVGLTLLILAAVGVSFIPAVGAVKIDIADAVRTKEV